jgi:diadenosine tetraphosphate (Ap4A) HIT family hydrolase
MADCLLCRLVRREVEVSMVHEDDWTVVFMDIRPIVPGHVLVVPRAHAPFLADLDPRTAPDSSASVSRLQQHCGGRISAATA